MTKRVISGVVAATAALALGPMTSPAAACTDTIQRFIPSECGSGPCPPPTYPRFAVNADGYLVVVCF